MSSNRINVNLAFNAETGKAKKQIQELQTLLNKIAYSGTTASPGSKMAADLRQASEAAKQLQYHLNNAFNVKTGNFDLSLLDRSLKSSKANITDLSRELLKAGQSGQQAFLGLAQSISLADQPMLKISNRLKELGVSLKNAVKWQLSSSIVHGFMGSIQSAYGYAQDLNESLNNIRIVTGYNVDRMAEFADQANKAAKALSTTTTEYTDASLIYFQQGLSDADVKKRTDTTIKLANVTGQSVEETANQMTAIWNNFEDGSKSLDYYADVITALGAATASSSKEISEGLNKFSAVAKSVGLSYEYASAALATVTATTRQSADIVGNAFKTLFARIQGLNLGETLDDGTTLNKYSEALFKVGINIKDQSGQLKDMNTILDEMGNKWGTLEKDQQIALAQTVAGVRQYTQLIALMENWDFFKENLGTAFGSEGVLNKQADIYAESWEAASKRVKASAESIYQNLIDDEFFISINNGLANLLTGIGAFVKEMGGAKALLTGFASIFLSNFANKIPEAIQTTVYNLQLLSSEGTKKVYNRIEEDIQKATQYHFQTGNISEDSSVGLAITQANELTVARSKLTLASNKLSASEKQMYDSQLSIIQQAQQEAIVIKQKNEQLEKEIQLSKEKIANNNVGKSAVSGATLEALKDSTLGLEGANSPKFQNILQTINNFSSKFREAKKQIEIDYNELNKTLSQKVFSKDFSSKSKDISMNLSNVFGSKIRENIKGMTTDIANLIHQYNQLGKNNPGKINAFTAIQDSIRGISDLIPQTIQEATGLSEVFGRLLAPGAMNSGTMIQDLNQINTILESGTIKGQDYETILRAFNSVDFEQLKAKMASLQQGQDQLAEKTGIIKNLLNEFNPQHTVKTSEALGSLAGMAGSAVMSVNSLVSAFKSLGNKDLSAWEKFSGFMTGISMAVPAAMSALRGLATVTQFVNTQVAAANTKLAAQIALENISAGSKKILLRYISEENLQLLTNMASKSKANGLSKEAAILEMKEALAKMGVTNARKQDIITQDLANRVYETQNKDILSLISLKAAELIQEKLLNKERTTSIALIKILNFLQEKSKLAGGLIVVAIAAIVAIMAALIKSIKTAEEKQKEAYETMKKSQEAYKEQKDTVSSLKDELESLSKTIDDLQKKGPLSLVEKQQLENAQKQKAQLEQQLALEQAILKAKQEQAIYDWKKNREDNANWAKESDKYSFELGKYVPVPSSIPPEYSELYYTKINTKEDFDKWFDKYRENYIKLNYELNQDGKYEDMYGETYTIDDLNAELGELYQDYYEVFNQIYQERLEYIQKNADAYIADLQGYQDQYENLTPKEKKDEATQTEIAKYQASLKEQGLIIYSSEEKYYDSLGASFQDSKNYGEVGKYILQNIETKDQAQLGKEIANKFDDTFKEMLNSIGISVDDYANYLATKYQEYNRIIAEANPAKDVSLASLTEADGWKAEYLDLLDDITIKEGDSIDKIIANLKQKAEEIAGITQEQADLEGWTTQYAEQMKVLSDLKQGDKISAEDYATLGDAYQGYFQKQLDGTYMLTAAADELKKASKDAHQANLIAQIGELKKYADIKNNVENNVNKYVKAFERGELSKTGYEYLLGAEKNKIENATGLQFDSYEAAKAYLDQLNQSLDDTQLAAALSAQSIEELNKMLNDSTIDQEEYDTALQSVLLTESQLAGVDFSSVIAYAEQMANLDSEKTAEDFYQIALAELKSSQAMENLADKSGDYIETIGTIEKNNGEITKLTADQAIAVDKLAQSFADLTGLEKEVFSADVITSDAIVNALKAVQDGAKGAREELSILLMMQANSNNRDAARFGDTLLDANKAVNIGEKAVGSIAFNLKQAYNELVRDNQELADNMLESAGWIIDEYGNFVKIFESAGLEQWQIDLKDAAEAIGLNYAEVQKYAELLKQLGIAINDIDAEKMALEWMKQDAALEKLNSGAKKYAETLALVAKKGEDAKDLDWLDTVSELRTYFSMLTGAEESVFDETFLLSDSVQQALLDMANGVEGSYDRLRGILELQAEKKWSEDIQNAFNKVAQLNIEVGASVSIDDKLIIQQLYDALKEAKIDAEQFFKDYLHLQLEVDEAGNINSATRIGDSTVKTIEEQAKAANIAYEDVQEYANLLLQLGRAMDKESAEAMALAIMEQSKGFDNLTDKAKDYLDVIKNIEDTKSITPEQSKSINDLADSLALLIGVEKEAFGDNLADFIASPAVMAAIEDLNNGVEGSIENLILLASLQASGFSTNKNGEVGNKELDNLRKLAIEASQTAGVGKEFKKDDELFDAYQKALKSKEEGVADAAKKALEDLGFVIENNGTTIIRKSLIPALAAGKSEIEKLSDSLGVSYDSVKKNAEILRTLYPELKNNEELSERMALAELAQSEAVKDLTDNYENYINILNTAEKSSTEYIQAYSAFKDDLTKITGITDADILDSLINNKDIQDALAKVVQGDEGSITELRIAVATKYFIDNEYGIDTKNIQDYLEQFKALNLNIPVGIELSDELDDQLEQIYNELKGKVDEEKLKTFFNDILGYAFTNKEGNIAFTKTVGDITQSIKDQAEAFDINYEEVQDYASQLRENHEVLEDDIKLSEKIALAGKKQAKGIEDLVDNYEDYAKVLKEAKLNKKIKDTEEYSKAIKNLRKDISLITGLEEDAFSEDFINSDETQQALTDIINGVDGAIEKFRILAVFDTLSFKFNIDDGELQTLYDDILQLNNEDIEIGATIDDAPALDTLANLINSVGMTADDIMEIFNSLGWEPEIEWQQMTAGAAGQTYNTGYMEVPEMTDYGSWSINAVPLTGKDAISGDTMVYVPVIKTKERGGSYKKISPPSGYTPKPSSSGGGGGGSAPKHAEKKNDSDKTRYHTLQNQLEDLKAEYDSISEAADRAFGKDKLKAIDSEISKTDELINKQKEYVDAIKANLPVDKAVMDAYYTDLIGGNIQYDERGNISNYDAIQDAMFNKYNQMTEMYDEDSQEWQVFEKKYEQLEKYIEQYEETYDLLRDEEEAYQDLLRQRIDLKLEKIQYSVEVQLEIPDNEIAVLEYKLGKIEDDAFKSAEAIGLLTREAEAVYDQIQINKQGLNDVLKLSLSTQEILQLMSGDTSVLANKTFTADQIEAIKEYRDNLLDLNGQFDDMRETIEEKVMEVFDAWNEKLDSGISKLDHYGNVIQGYKNIIDVVGKDALGLTDTFMATLNQSSIDNAINKLSSTKKSYEVMIDAQSKAKQALEEAKARNDESSIKMWEENLQSITEEAESAREEMLSAWEEALNGVAEQFEATVERVVDIFNKEVYTLGGLEGLSEDFSNQQENADIMLDDYQKIYELSKLNRDINKSINDIDSLSGKQKLKKLLEQINALQEDGLEMSQYDLEYLQKTYDLRMAEIELEEARNAKNTVRLRKDNEGNWSYVYTQNMDAVDTAQQKYEDALYAMQEVSSNYIDEMSEKLISTSQEMEEALAAIRIQDFASIDDYYAEVQRVQQQYEEELLMQQNELQKAIDNNKILYDEDWTNYHNATGYKISDTENFATTFRDTLLGSLLGSEEDTANFTDIIGSAVNTLTQGLMAGAEIYYANLEAAMNAAGTSTGNFAEDTAANIDAVVEKSIEGAEAVDQMAIEMIDAFNEITNSVQNWQESYGTAMQAIIDSNLAVIESFNQMLEALSIDPNSITVRYDLINSNNAPQQFASGGYTGEWGNYGKLAILDEKELILNQNDTTNFLKALGIAQTILDTIDLNATQASYGFGNLVPATINENNSQTIEQDVHITAEFPNATDKNEIEQAFETLINKASQYANRR